MNVRVEFKIYGQKPLKCVSMFIGREVPSISQSFALVCSSYIRFLPSNRTTDHFIFRLMIEIKPLVRSQTETDVTSEGEKYDNI